MLALLSYAGDAAVAYTVALSSRAIAKVGVIRLAVVGGGDFATAMHLPLIQTMPEFALAAIVNRTGHKAMALAKRFGAEKALTDFDAILGDPGIDAVLLCTRHDLHASQTMAALGAGKHVLVEKPLALNRRENHEIRALMEKLGERAPVLLCGFNRRFSPFVTTVMASVAKRSNPMILNYRMNAGHIPGEHWVHSAQGGGRNIGEASHIYDLFTAVTGARVKSVTASAIDPRTEFYRLDDNFVATIAFEDGSVASLTYTALGNPSYPKEKLELYSDGTVFSLDDYRSLAITGRPGGYKSKSTEKGHAEEWKAFAAAVHKGRQAVPLWQTFQAMEIAFLAEDAFRGRK
jgi:predicted dehydrogenase